jgi:hypothetical protein
MEKKKSKQTEKIISDHFKKILVDDSVRNAELDQENTVDLPLEPKGKLKNKKDKNEEIAEEC